MKQLLLSIVLASSSILATAATSFSPGEIWPDNNGVFTPIDGTAANAPMLIGSNLHIP